MARMPMSSRPTWPYTHRLHALHLASVLALCAAQPLAGTAVLLLLGTDRMEASLNAGEQTWEAPKACVDTEFQSWSSPRKAVREKQSAEMRTRNNRRF